MSISLGTAVLIGLGVTAVGAIGTVVVAKEGLEKKELESKISLLENDIKILNDKVSTLNSILPNIDLGIDNLKMGKKNFADGGWVNAEIPLANEEFIKTISTLEAAKSFFEKTVTKLNSQIQEKEKELDSKKAELSK